MLFGPKKGSFVSVFENFFRNFGFLIIAVVIALVKHDFSIIFQNIAVLFVVFFGPIDNLFKFLFTQYSIDDKKLLIKSGFIVKKDLEIPISTITTVDLTQSVLHQIFNVYKINIDNASNVSDSNTKIKMTFSKEDAFLIRRLLIKNCTESDGFNLSSNNSDYSDTNSDGKILDISMKDVFIMSLFGSKVVYLLGFCGLFYSGIMFLDSIIKLPEKKLEHMVEVVYASGYTVFAIIILVLVTFLFGILFGIIGNFIRYYDFTVKDLGDKLVIEYGFFTKKRYTIHKNKINGFSYTQSLAMRLFKLGTLRLFAIGYGGQSDDESSEDPMIFPIIKENIIYKTLEDILPEMKEIDEYSKPEVRSLKYFFYNVWLLISIIITIGLAIVFWNNQALFNLWILGLILIILSVINIIMEFKNTGIYGNDKNISISSGGFRKTTYFIKTNNVESISEKASILKRKKGVTSIEIKFIAPLVYSSQKAKNIDLRIFDDIKSKLIY